MTSDYLVEYQINGKPNVFEFFLFVNPLGQKCLQCEHEMIHVFERMAVNVDFHILPLVTDGMIREFSQRMTAAPYSIELRNYFYKKVYLAALAYKAAGLQNKRFGRRFLMALQQTVGHQIDDFNETWLHYLAQSTHLDYDMFVEDLESDLVKQLFFKDQRIAREAQVNETPTLVIFEHQSNTCVHLVQNEITAENVFRVLDQINWENYQRMLRHASHACKFIDIQQKRLS